MFPFILRQELKFLVCQITVFVRSVNFYRFRWCTSRNIRTVKVRRVIGVPHSWVIVVKVKCSSVSLRFVKEVPMCRSFTVSFLRGCPSDWGLRCECQEYDPLLVSWLLTRPWRTLEGPSVVFSLTKDWLLVLKSTSRPLPCGSVLLVRPLSCVGPFPVRPLRSPTEDTPLSSSHSSFLPFPRFLVRSGPVPQACREYPSSPSGWLTSPT